MRKAVILAAALACTALSSVANAQIYGENDTGEGTPYGLRARFGVVFPLDDALRNVSGTFLGLGIDYTFEKSFIPGSQTFLSIDWLFKSSRADRGNLFPIMVNQRFYLGQDQEYGRRSYAFLGLGAVIIDVRPSSTRFGVRGGFGVELSEVLFGEASILISDKARNGGPSATSIGAYIGYRF